MKHHTSEIYAKIFLKLFVASGLTVPCGCNQKQLLKHLPHPVVCHIYSKGHQNIQDVDITQLERF